MLAKLRNSKKITSDINEELLEDAFIENKQALEMARIYSDIQSGMMDAFASVISNNLNVVMKKLTLISIILMIPTLIGKYFWNERTKFIGEFDMGNAFNNFKFNILFLFRSINI